MNRIVHRLKALPAAAIVGLVVMSVIAGASPAGAHTGDQVYVYLDVTESSLAGRIEAPIPDLAEVLDLTTTDNDTFIEANNAAIVEYLTEHFEVVVDSEVWTIDPGEAGLFFSEETEIDDNYVVVPFTVAVESADGTVPRTFDVRLDAMVDTLSDRNSLLLIGNDWTGGVIDNGYDSLAAFDDGTRTQTIDLGQPSQMKNLTASVEQGVKHIRTGPDHILFVLVLLLPAVLVFRSGWWPTTGFGSSLWRVLKIVTMFTVAHSITFTLAGLELLPLPPSKLVEFIIALSIAVAALHNIRPMFPNKEWMLSFVFGLFHGMGFASLVEGLDVSRGTQLISLLGRNIGIEIGQAVVVLALFPALYLLRRTRFYLPFFTGASVVMALVALAWMVERLAEIEVGINPVMDLILGWPQIVVLVVALTVVALAAYRREVAAGRLLPTIDDMDDAEDSKHVMDGAGDQDPPAREKAAL